MLIFEIPHKLIAERAKIKFKIKHRLRLHQHRAAAYLCVVLVRSCVPNMPCRRRRTERFQGQFFRAHGRPRRKSHAACNGRKYDFQTSVRCETIHYLRRYDCECLPYLDASSRQSHNHRPTFAWRFQCRFGALLRA